MGERRPRLPIRGVPSLDKDEDRATEEARRAADDLLKEITAATAEPLPGPRSERVEHAVATVPRGVDLRSTDSRVKIDPEAVAEALPEAHPGDVTIPPNRAVRWTPPTAAEYAASLGEAAERDASGGALDPAAENPTKWTVAIPRAVVTWVRRVTSRSRGRD